MKTMTKTNQIKKESLRHLQAALKRTFIGINFLNCDLQDLEKVVQEESDDEAPR